MLQMSRKCVPYTPVTAKLAEMTIALVSSTGAYAEGQEPYGDDTDSSFRIIPPETAATALRFKHGHYDTSAAEQDPNTVFPLELLHHLASQGAIKRVSNKHVGFRGFSTDLKQMYEKVAPAIAAEIERSQADAVLLTAGWPLCHRVIVACQREIEAKGIPTILITVLPEESRTMRPPRALHPVGHKLGRVLGQPGERDHQLRVLRAALAQLEERHQPGEIISFQP